MTISILGCGWLGLPLGATLVRNGHTVRGTTTSPDKLDRLRDAGIDPYRIALTPEWDAAPGTADALFDADVLFLNVPPTRGRDNLVAYHTAQIQAVQERVRDSRISWVLFASTTGVYPGGDRILIEDDQPPGAPDALPGRRRDSGAAVLQAEGQLMDDDAFDTTILRFGGLYGDDRHPARYMAGRTGLGRPHAPVNLIHQDDCIGIVQALLADGSARVRNTVFNAVADAHPSRQTLYTAAAIALGLEPPTFDASDDSGGKEISNQRLHDVLDYRFVHSSPLDDVTT